jgi:hypothetical protein
MKLVSVGLTLGLSFTLAACEGIFDSKGDESITLSTEQRTYNKTDTVFVVLTNRSTSVLLFNSCIDSTIHKDGESLPKPTVCAAYLEELPPHASVQMPYFVRPEWTSGQYRISLSVGIGNLETRRVVQTDVFTVRN